MENVNIMDVASTELTQDQLDSITAFAEAKRQDEDYIVNVVGGNNAKIVYNKQKQIVRDHIKIGRNELCPCGSGKKYKNCCLKTGEYETKHTI